MNNNIYDNEFDIKSIIESIQDAKTIMKLENLKKDYMYINNLTDLYLHVKLLRRVGIEKFPQITVNQIIEKYQEQIKEITDYYGIKYEELIIVKQVYTDQEFIQCLHIRNILEIIRNQISTKALEDKVCTKILDSLCSENN